MNAPKLSAFEEISRRISPTILFSLFIVLLTIGIIWWWIKHRQYRLKQHETTLLLCGISNSGKTLLFNRLTSNTNQEISYSTTIHHGIMTLDYLSTDRPIRKVHVIDVPSHSHQDFHLYKTTIKGIIFVIDSSTIEKEIQQVTDYLDDILHEEYLQKQHLPLLIFCNKQDLDRKHHDLQTIRQLLEDQLLVNLNKDLRIEFVEGSVLNIGTKSLDKQNETIHTSTSHLLQVHQWIARIWFK